MCNFIFNINTSIKDITIIDREIRIRSKKHETWKECEKWYKYHCNKCGNEDWLRESHMKKNVGCNACGVAPKKAKLGINTIWDTDRWMCDLGVSEEDAKRYTKGSNKKIKVTCPDCGFKKLRTIKCIYGKKSIACSCRDGRSYPEKFMFSLLKQLGVEFETEKVFNWSNQRRYDFYIPVNNIIIEMHGMQHYKDQNRKGARTLKEEQDNDKIKKELALKNGVKNYITIDARKSDIEWIKNNILNSELNDMFDLSEMDWLNCGAFALSNRVKEVCNYWNCKEDYETISDLIKLFKLKRRAIINYLKKGTELGWCNYDAKEEHLNRDRVEYY